MRGDRRGAAVPRVWASDPADDAAGRGVLFEGVSDAAVADPAPRGGRPGRRRVHVGG